MPFETSNPWDPLVEGRLCIFKGKCYHQKEESDNWNMTRYELAWTIMPTNHPMICRKHFLFGVEFMNLESNDSASTEIPFTLWNCIFKVEEHLKELIKNPTKEKRLVLNPPVLYGVD